MRKIGCLLLLWMYGAFFAGFQNGFAASGSMRLFPSHMAKEVSPDTHLRITFPEVPVLGKSGLIRIYDAADDR